jgi:hypothetical protein
MNITEETLLAMGAAKNGAYYVFNNGPLFRLSFYQPPGATDWFVNVGVLNDFYRFDASTWQEVFAACHKTAVAFGVKEYKSQVRSVIHDLMNPPVN